MLLQFPSSFQPIKLTSNKLENTATLLFDSVLLVSQEREQQMLTLYLLTASFFLDLCSLLFLPLFSLF